MNQKKRRCEKCKGTGHTYAETGSNTFIECFDCNGTGYKSDEEMHKIEREKFTRLEVENRISNNKLARIRKILEEK